MSSSVKTDSDHNVPFYAGHAHDSELFLYFATGQCECEDAGTKRYPTCPPTHLSVLLRASTREASEDQIHSSLHSAEQGPSNPLSIPPTACLGHTLKSPSLAAQGKKTQGLSYDPGLVPHSPAERK